MSARQNVKTIVDSPLVASPSGIVTENGFIPCGKLEAVSMRDMFQVPGRIQRTYPKA